MKQHLVDWIGGNPWEVVPLHGMARVYVALLGLASIVGAVSLGLDHNSIIVVEGWQYVSPFFLVLGGVACTVWAWQPTWRLAYAVGGSVLATCYLFRGMGALVSLALTPPPTAPWALVLGYIVYTMLGLSILMVWRYLAPVIKPRVPPTTRR